MFYETTLCFFCGTEVKDLDICIVLSPYAQSKIKSGTLTSFVNQKRLPGVCVGGGGGGGDRMLIVGENIIQVSQIPQVI